MICRNKDKGFTFIELILYMAILGIFMWSNCGYKCAQ